MNDKPTASPAMPVFQYHAVSDEMVHNAQAATLHREWCSAGANLLWREYPVPEHALGALAGVSDVQK